MTSRSIIGFDSAWTDNASAPGAICVLRQRQEAGWEFSEPLLKGFDAALEVIRIEAARSEHCLVAIDQPTIVPNHSGSRPVDKVAASVISFIGGGVQPANRSKKGMFDDEAPIWRFKGKLGAREDPEQARGSTAGLFLIEVFPALALASFDSRFHARLAGPRYNPARKKTFRQVDWLLVLDAVEAIAHIKGVSGLADWCHAQRQLTVLRKADQDRLDSVLCALIGHHWLTAPRDASIIIGDLEHGYMVAPASPSVRTRLSIAAQVRQVPIDGMVA